MSRTKYKEWQNPLLECSVCGYVPEDRDLLNGSYELGKCPVCGKEKVCGQCRKTGKCCK